MSVNEDGNVSISHMLKHMLKREHQTSVVLEESPYKRSEDSFTKSVDKENQSASSVSVSPTKTKAVDYKAVFGNLNNSSNIACGLDTDFSIPDSSRNK